MIRFTIILRDLKCSPSCPFTCSWTRGAEPTINPDFVNFELKPEEDARFEIKFIPTEPGEYAFEVPIDLESDDTVQPYNKIILTGKLSKPIIESDVLEVFLIPMPLKVMTSRKFAIAARNFPEISKIRSKICCLDKLSGKYCNDPLKISFPGGDTIQARCK